MGAKWFWKVQMYGTPCRNEFSTKHIDAEPEWGCSGGTENCELHEQWVGSRIKGQIHVQLKGRLSSEVHHRHLIGSNECCPEQNQPSVTGHRVCLKEALFPVILCGEASQACTEMRGRLYVTGDGTWFTVIQKMKYGDLFKSLSFPEGTCHLRISSFNIFHGLRRPGVTLGWSHLLPFPWWNYFYVNCLCIVSESCTGAPHFIAPTLWHFSDTAFVYTFKGRPSTSQKSLTSLLQWSGTKAAGALRCAW